jgi:hypothetical protein
MIDWIVEHPVEMFLIFEVIIVLAVACAVIAIAVGVLDKSSKRMDEENAEFMQLMSDFRKRHQLDEEDIDDEVVERRLM